MITQALKIILMRKDTTYMGRIFYPILAVLISLLLQLPGLESLFCRNGFRKGLNPQFRFVGFQLCPGAYGIQNESSRRQR